MRPIKILLMLGFVVSCLAKDAHAQQPVNKTEALDKKQQSIVTISAFTAKGDLVQLQKALSEGLDAGLTINEIKEVLVQLYAYAGFPRSLNALQTFMTVLKERKQKGITDAVGKLPTPVTGNKTKSPSGEDNRTKLVGRTVKGEVYEFAPAIDQFLKDHLFGDIFGRDNLDWKTRELATIAALAALGGVENQLRSHFGVGMYNGLSAAQLTQLVSIIHSEVGSKEGIAASQALQTVLKQPQDKASATNKAAEQDVAETIFPTGEKITNNNFTGNAWLQQLITTDSSNNIQVGNVTFEPGARSNWHLHPGGQILLVTDGVGYYQEKGSPKRILRKGDVVKCPPNVLHWHGASHDQKFIQVAITNTQRGAVVWLQPVTDEEYNSIQ
ncbi:MAG: carboxymuconolactone decarboxylase family protein [Chitinophagaceae bacterium]